ncbi:MAG: hypothetical protein H6822_25450 [Planctomycetaceae bacterium]|nr:hypothetical protein [Planctomycetaceae bacterium]
MSPDPDEKTVQSRLITTFALVGIGGSLLGGSKFAMMCIGLTAVLLFGILLIRAAVVNRNDGWISGAVFGSRIVIIGAATSVVSIIFLACSPRT